ncbi:hypothetical protein [Arthrobacter sp. HY1533]|uniref:hypothetical protein n=1 Tax=Arthrobacter sp. HY1533 TaxID=2970919 RepID=UPI0022B9E8C2|nr:hypothetical protein [Arthrobacter sp. HY1533]
MDYIKTVKPGSWNSLGDDPPATPEEEDKAKWCVLNKAPIGAVESILAALGIPDPPLSDLI